MIDLKFCYGYELGKIDVRLYGVLDGISYDIFCLKEEDYVMKIMATYGSINCPPIWQRVKARRTIANDTKVEFEYIDPVANHFDYRHCVDNNNHLQHMRPSIRETWKTHRWVLRVLAFFHAGSELNAFLCFRYFVWNKLNRMYFHAFRRALSIEMMQNTFDEDDGVEDSNQEPRSGPRQTIANNHELTSAHPKTAPGGIWGKVGYKIVKIHINRFVVAPGVQRRLVRSIHVIWGRYIVQLSMCYMFIMFYPEALPLRLKLSIRNKKQQLNMEYFFWYDQNIIMVLV
jgi:hypothetical protein